MPGQSVLESNQPPVDKSAVRVREMFRQIAPNYDRMNHVLSLNLDRYWRKRTVAAFPWDESELSELPFLDMCTGTGDLAIALRHEATRRGQSRQILASDFCGSMLRIAADKSVNSGDIHYLEADSMALPMDDGVFAAVSVAFGLRNIVDTDAGIREMVRVCAPGGTVLILEFSRPRMVGIRQGYHLYFKYVLPRIGQAFAKNDKSAYEYLPASVSQFPDYEALVNRMTDAGLVDCTYHPMTFGTTTLYVGHRPTQAR